MSDILRELGLTDCRQHGRQRCDDDGLCLLCKFPPSLTTLQDILDAPLPPVARHTDPPTSHEAAAAKDDAGLWVSIRSWLQQNGPATEEEVLKSLMPDRERSDNSSIFCRMRRAGWLVLLVDALGRKIKYRNSSSRWAQVQALPSHQADPQAVARAVARQEAERSI